MLLEVYNSDSRCGNRMTNDCCWICEESIPLYVQMYILLSRHTGLAGIFVNLQRDEKRYGGFVFLYFSSMSGREVLVITCRHCGRFSV